MFDAEDVLQETIIIKIKKTFEKPETIKITSTHTNKEFNKCNEIIVPYDLVVSGEQLYVYLVTNKEDKNYLFVKRFTAKEEHRRLQCGIYLSKRFPQFEKISTQNKINFIDGSLIEMPEHMIHLNGDKFMGPR